MTQKKSKNKKFKTKSINSPRVFSKTNSSKSKFVCNKTSWIKVTDQDGKAIHGGDFTYSLPKNGRPGKWTPVVKDPMTCQRGYHVTRIPVAWTSKRIHASVLVDRGKK